MTEEELMVHDFINSSNYPRYSKVMKILSNTVECKHMYNIKKCQHQILNQ